MRCGLARCLSGRESEMGRFPEIKELKRAVRDIVCPDMDLGHTDSV